ncbi:MAG: VOC family protein [Acidobacteriota bacterium]|nr:VOC family protein [Acidobacteriota bacterium]
MSIAGGKPNDRRIATHLIVKGVDRAIDFYGRAFGADVLYRSQTSTDGRALHAQLRIFDSIVLLSEENMGMPEEAMARFETGMRTRSPESLKATTAILEVYVDDVDGAFRRAIDAGAIPRLPVGLAFYGDRYGQVVDPFGHVWALATEVERLTPGEVDQRAMEHFGQMQTT